MSVLWGVPDVPSANIGTAAIMIGERAADLVCSARRTFLSPGSTRTGE